MKLGSAGTTCSSPCRLPPSPQTRARLLSGQLPAAPQLRSNAAADPTTGTLALPSLLLPTHPPGDADGFEPIPEPPPKFNVRDFGARGDNATDDTAALQVGGCACVGRDCKGVVSWPPSLGSLPPIYSPLPTQARCPPPALPSRLNPLLLRRLCRRRPRWLPPATRAGSCCSRRGRTCSRGRWRSTPPTSCSEEKG